MRPFAANKPRKTTPVEQTASPKTYPLRDYLNHGFVNVVFTDPKPEIVIIDLHGKDTIFKRHPRGPEFLPAPLG